MPPAQISASAASNYFTSPRLIFRAVDFEGDAALIHRFESDPSDHLFANGGMSKPRSKKSTDSFRKWLVEETLLGAVISLKPEGPDAEAVPIGTVSLEQQWGPHHRTAVMGISIGSEFRGKSYGGEAITWAVEWGFRAAGLHRIEIGHFSWNEGAGRLYERLGFREEGRRKECFWFNGGWGDEIILATREDTWVFGQNEKKFGAGKEDALEQQIGHQEDGEELSERASNVRNRLVM